MGRDTRPREDLPYGSTGDAVRIRISSTIGQPVRLPNNGISQGREHVAVTGWQGSLRHQFYRPDSQGTLARRSPDQKFVRKNGISSAFARSMKKAHTSGTMMNAR